MIMNEITEEQYAKLHPFLPVQRGNVRISNITVINALLYIAENRCSWRALPKHFGNWYTIHARMRRWAHSGALHQLFVALREMNLTDAGVECLNIDMASVKTHPDGAGAQKKTGRKSSANKTRRSN